MRTVKSTPLYATPNSCRLNYGVLFGMNGIAQLVPRTALHALLLTHAHTLIGTALNALGCSVISRCNDALVLYDYSADVAILFKATRPTADLHRHIHKPLVPLIHKTPVKLFYHGYFTIL